MHLLTALGIFFFPRMQIPVQWIESSLITLTFGHIWVVKS